MSIKQLAGVYARYINAGGDIAANAPRELALFYLGLDPETDRNLVGQAFLAIASGAAVPEPAPGSLLAWYAASRQAEERCNKILAGRQPPKNMSTLLRGGYLAEADAIKTAVRAFLQSEINKFE